LVFWFLLSAFGIFFYILESFFVDFKHALPFHLCSPNLSSSFLVFFLFFYYFTGFSERLSSYHLDQKEVFSAFILPLFSFPIETKQTNKTN